MQSGGAISLGIDTFKTTSGPALPSAIVYVDSSQLTGNVATVSGGAISSTSGTIVITVSRTADSSVSCLFCSCILHAASRLTSPGAVQNSVLDSNVAGGPLMSTGVGGSIFAQDYCQGGICTSLTSVTISTTNITNNYAHLVCSQSSCTRCASVRPVMTTYLHERRPELEYFTMVPMSTAHFR